MPRPCHIAGKIGLDGADIVRALGQCDVEAEGPPDTVGCEAFAAIHHTVVVASSNSVTVAPVSPFPLIVNPDVRLVMLSVFDVPLSSRR